MPWVQPRWWHEAGWWRRWVLSKKEFGEGAAEEGGVARHKARDGGVDEPLGTMWGGWGECVSGWCPQKLQAAPVACWAQRDAPGRALSLLW